MNHNNSRSNYHKQQQRNQNELSPYYFQRRNQLSRAPPVDLNSRTANRSLHSARRYSPDMRRANVMNDAGPPNEQRYVMSDAGPSNQQYVMSDAGPSNQQRHVMSDAGPSNQQRHVMSDAGPSNQQQYVMSDAGPSNQQRYVMSDAGPSNQRYVMSDAGPSNQQRYVKSDAGPSNQQRYVMSDAGPSNQQRYVMSDAGPSNQQRYVMSDAGPSNQQRYGRDIQMKMEEMLRLLEMLLQAQNLDPKDVTPIRCEIPPERYGVDDLHCQIDLCLNYIHELMGLEEQGIPENDRVKFAYNEIYTRRGQNRLEETDRTKKENGTSLKDKERQTISIKLNNANQHNEATTLQDSERMIIQNGDYQRITTSQIPMLCIQQHQGQPQQAGQTIVKHEMAVGTTDNKQVVPFINYERRTFETRKEIGKNDKEEKDNDQQIVLRHSTQIIEKVKSKINDENNYEEARGTVGGQRLVIIIPDTKDEMCACGTQFITELHDVACGSDIPIDVTSITTDDSDIASTTYEKRETSSKETQTTDTILLINSPEPINNTEEIGDTNDTDQIYEDDSEEIPEEIPETEVDSEEIPEEIPETSQTQSTEQIEEIIDDNADDDEIEHDEAYGSRLNSEILKSASTMTDEEPKSASTMTDEKPKSASTITDEEEPKQYETILNNETPMSMTPTMSDRESPRQSPSKSVSSTRDEEGPKQYETRSNNEAPASTMTDRESPKQSPPKSVSSTRDEEGPKQHETRSNNEAPTPTMTDRVSPRQSSPKSASAITDKDNLRQEETRLNNEATKSPMKDRESPRQSSSKSASPMTDKKSPKQDETKSKNEAPTSPMKDRESPRQSSPKSDSPMTDKESPRQHETKSENEAPTSTTTDRENPGQSSPKSVPATADEENPKQSPKPDSLAANFRKALKERFLPKPKK